MEQIAIVGMGCRFPGASDPQAFWQLLRDGVDAITEVPPDRWDVDSLYELAPSRPGKMSTRWGGFLEQVDQFDAQFFGIAPREAVYMDPQQRLLLEVAYSALEDAGQVVEHLAGSQTGVFIGIGSSDYQKLFQAELSALNAYMATGNTFSIAANRLSYFFDFRGPSIAVDTACSSSLVAVHLACQSLRSGESDLALAGGVNLLLSPEVTIVLSQAQMMSPDGRCKTFDAAANGYVRGEGCGVVVLKRLSDAQRDGDRILALIRGSAINQDGRSNGLTAPNGPAQEALIRQALANAKVSAAEISYVEAHGTGTALGDPIEAEALGSVLRTDRPPDRFCAIGSAKTNVGHLEAAAGIVGLIKVALMLQHRQIPPSLHFQTPNPYIPFAKLPLRVQQTLESWTDAASPFLAGVSSFGFGGANAHVILQEFCAPTNPRSQPQPTTAPPYLLPLSARSPAALRSLAEAYQSFLDQNPAALADICYTASLRRSHHDHRLAMIGHDRGALQERLAAFLRNETRPGLLTGCRQRHHRPKLVFVFSGQGPQWWGMGRELLHQEPVFREVVEQCDRLLRGYVSWSLLSELLADEAHSRIGETEVAQPAIFALQVALAALWRSWGIEPSAIVGHSIGEVAAAHVAGVLSLEDAIRVVFHRSRLMQQGTGKGKMAAVELTVAEAEALLAEGGDRLSIAAINSPTSLTLSGEEAALESVLQTLEQQQKFCRRLPVNYAFHSAQMQPFQAELVASLADIQPQLPTVSIVSTVTGQLFAAGDFSAAYWGRNIREPVRFADAIATLLQKKHTLFLELSPHPVLAMNISQCLRQQQQTGTVLPSLRRKEADRATLLSSLAALYTLGYPIAWQHLYPPGNCVMLPAYPWQRSRYWIETAATQPRSTMVIAPSVAMTSESTPLESQRSDTEITASLPAWVINRAQLLATEPADRQPLLESYLSEVLARVLGMSAAQLDLEQPLHSLGLDSLMAAEIRSRIETDLEVAVPLEYFAGLSIDQFVTQVLLMVEGKGKAAGEQARLVESDVDREPISATTGLPENPWLPRYQPSDRATLRLFCLPYAGAGASLFRHWFDDLAPEIEVCPIQLPGREERLGEQPFTRLSALVQTLAPLLESYLDKPFAFFGHSVGALVSFELIRELRRRQLPAPVHLFVSGGRSPQLPDLAVPIHRQPEPKFLESLRRLNGTPEAVLQNPELMQLFLPALRSDFALLETYFYTAQDPLPCTITAFGGEQDPRISPADLAAWRDQTRSDFTMKLFPGDHFFLHPQHTALMQAIAQLALSTVQPTQEPALT